MSEDIHSLVAQWLAAHPVADVPGAERVVKAGILPFVRAEGRFAVMKPVAKRPELGLPPFQIAKGTRMRREAGGWVDMREGEQADALSEPLAATALREGIEELGLVLPAITALTDLGTVGFASASTGKSKLMRLFAAEAAGREAIAGEAAPTTAERAWLTAEEFRAQGRADHRAALERARDAL